MRRFLLLLVLAVACRARESGWEIAPDHVGPVRFGMPAGDTQRAAGDSATTIPATGWEAGWRSFIYIPPADSLNAIVFETDGQTVRTYRVGRRPQVEDVERCG